MQDRRIPLQAWAYNAIRTAFKVETEDFEGYDDEDEWNVINAQPLANRSTPKQCFTITFNVCFFHFANICTTIGLLSFHTNQQTNY